MPNSKRLTRACLALAVTLVPLTAAADDGKKFADLDRNSDGYLSASEISFDRRLLERFTQLDVDGDGRISAAEWRARAGVRGAGRG